jgi:serine/threonine protein kinase
MLERANRVTTDKPLENEAAERDLAESPRNGFADGTQIGPYRIVRRAGEGGFGVIYLAEQQEPVVRPVALKVLKAGMDSRQIRARFEAERSVLAVMNHPGIAAVYDAGETKDGRSYFVMEWVSGEPITDFCDRHSLGVRKRLELFTEVCRAVQHAHQKGIIHRDIKPSNILVAERANPIPKVIDFGIAKAVQGGSLADDGITLTSPFQLLGTPEYMSPEQMSPGQIDVDTQSDVYSLGILLYEMLTGTTPMRRKDLGGSSYLEVVNNIREATPLKPSTCLGEMERGGQKGHSNTSITRTSSKRLRGDLDWIVMKALENDRSRRYQSASALAADIDRHLRNEPVSAGPPSRFYRTRKFVRRHRREVAAAAVIAASLVGGSWFSISMTARANEARAVEKEMADEFTIERDSRAQKQREAEQLATAMIEGLDDKFRIRGSPKLMERVIDRATKYFESFPESEPNTERELQQSIVTAALARLEWNRGEFDQAAAKMQTVVDLRKRLVASETAVGRERFAAALADAYGEAGEWFIGN